MATYMQHFRRQRPWMTDTYLKDAIAERQALLKELRAGYTSGCRGGVDEIQRSLDWYIELLKAEPVSLTE